MVRLIVDGVAFQTGAWARGKLQDPTRLLTALANSGKHDIVLLDRGHSPHVDGIVSIPFPAHRPGRDGPADSALIQQVCDHYRADAFIGSDCTTPLTTPMLMILSEGFSGPDNDIPARAHGEMELAIAYALRYLCVSKAIELELMARYPEIPPERVAVAPVGWTARPAPLGERGQAASADPVETALAQQLGALVSDAKSGRFDHFFAQWARLRHIQGTVDYL